MLFAPVVIFYILIFKIKSRLFSHIYFVIVSCLLLMFVMYNYLIDISFMISAQGIFEKGNKCATGAIIFYPIGFFFNICGIAPPYVNQNHP